MNEFESIEKYIKKRRLKSKENNEIISLILKGIIVLVCLYAVFTKIFMFYRVSGMENFPTLKDSDLVLIYRLENNYAKEDLVAFENDGNIEVGRIIGFEGDKITITYMGNVLINGTQESNENILYPTYINNVEDDTEFIVDENEVYILKDYRTNANDSREYGSVSLDSIKGKVITILRRRSL